MEFLNNFRFADPWYLLLLLAIPGYVLWQRNRQPATGTYRISTVAGLAGRRSWKAVLLPLLLWLYLAAVVCSIVALARPQSGNVREMMESEGIDIVISLDVSGSMLAEDFSPNRIEAAKKLAAEFVDGRPGDRIGLVTFAGESFTQCPVTTDHAVLKAHLDAVQSGLLIDGTAIGMGLSTAVDRLRSSKGKSRIAILLTDGVNNTGEVDPQTALEIAKAYNVRVYTIGVGTNGNAPYPLPMPGGGMVRQMQPVQIDEPLLTKIASETGGRYFRATNNASLREIYAAINRLEKYKVEVSTFKEYAELYYPLALAAALLLFVALLLRYTVLKSVTM